MSARDWLDAPGMRAALAALAAAVALVVWALVAPIADAPARDAPADALALPRRGATATAPTGVTFDDDPFSADRTPPAERYRPPWSEDDVAGGAPAGEAPPAVLGTVVSSGGGDAWASVRLGDAAPRLVRVGESVGTYTVRAIARGRVTFTSGDGERIEVRAASPFSGP